MQKKIFAKFTTTTESITSLPTEQYQMVTTQVWLTDLPLIGPNLTH